MPHTVEDLHPNPEASPESIREVAQNLRKELGDAIFEANLTKALEDPEKGFLELKPLLQGGAFGDRVFQSFLDAVLQQRKDTPPNPELVARYFALYATKPYAEDVCYRMAELDAEVVLSLRDQLTPLSWGAEVLDYAERKFYGEKVDPLNTGHDLPDAERFKSLEGVPQEELFRMITCTFRSSDEPLYTSSFFGIYDRMVGADLRAYDVLKAAQFERLGVFFSACAAFGKLEDFLSRLSEEEKQDCLDRLTRSLVESAQPLEEGIVIAEMLEALEAENLLPALEARLATWHATVERVDTRTAIEVVGAFLGHKFQMETPWVKSMQERHPTVDMSGVDFQGVHEPLAEIQLFYDDEDGRATYKNFVRFYQGKGWAFKDHGTYITFTRQQKGETTTLYANKPESEGEGPLDIGVAVSDQRVVAFAHRGHSYHVPASLDVLSHLQQQPDLVFLGSCGGHGVLNDVLSLVPEAQIVSTRARGARAINEPLLGLMNESIAGREYLSWDTLWQDAEGLVGDDPLFEEYVPPSNNVAVEMIRTYHRGIREVQERVALPKEGSSLY